MINQGENFIYAETISWFHLPLNYMVPYMVASYSAAKNAIETEEKNNT